MHRLPLVVLVDENPANLVELTRALMVLEVSLAWFTSTADALGTVHRVPPAIVICGPDVSSEDAAYFLEDVRVRSPGTQRLLLRTREAQLLPEGTTVLPWPSSPAKLRDVIASSARFPFGLSAAE
jgi:hypothetical protein